MASLFQRETSNKATDQQPVLSNETSSTSLHTFQDRGSEEKVEEEPREKPVDSVDVLIAEAAVDTKNLAEEVFDEPAPQESAARETATSPTILHAEDFDEEATNTEIGTEHTKPLDVTTSEVATSILDEILAGVLARMQESGSNITPSPEAEDLMEGEDTEVIQTQHITEVSTRLVSLIPH